MSSNVLGSRGRRMVLSRMICGGAVGGAWRGGVSQRASEAARASAAARTHVLVLHHPHQCDLAKRPLGECVVLESVGDLLDGDHLPCVLILRRAAEEGTTAAVSPAARWQSRWRLGRSRRARREASARRRTRERKRRRAGGRAGGGGSRSVVRGARCGVRGGGERGGRRRGGAQGGRRVGVGGARAGGDSQQSHAPHDAVRALAHRVDDGIISIHVESRAEDHVALDLPRLAVRRRRARRRQRGPVDHPGTRPSRVLHLAQQPASAPPPRPALPDDKACNWRREQGRDHSGPPGSAPLDERPKPWRPPGQVEGGGKAPEGQAAWGRNPRLRDRQHEGPFGLRQTGLSVHNSLPFDIQ